MANMLSLRYAAASVPGVRSRNEDSVLAGPRLLAVADGMGGHAHGEVASAVVIGVLAELDERVRTAKPGEVDAVSALGATVARALRRLTELADADPELTGMGSTLTALLWDGASFGVAHVGDSRGYLLRDGVLQAVTRDHTLVQSLVDEGRITAEEAAVHPRRSMLVRSLQAGGAAEPDLTLVPATAGDRFVLCSDGVTCVLPDDAVRDTLGTAPSPSDAARLLVDEAVAAHSPDNVSCVVVDVVADGAADGDLVVAGAAGDRPDLVRVPQRGKLSRLARRILPG
ncbi:MAG TPA: protein phosphatase 2C domain-containing protein [Pseudonocardiaceae bacterium]|jgi:protein phosphatase|nr:protein phosphatase 2C domain-containing protein [Pseudonocardiaceae bacterium]